MKCDTQDVLQAKFLIKQQQQHNNLLNVNPLHIGYHSQGLL